MRTTLDIPDELFAQAKIRAVKEKTSLKTVFVRALEHEFSSGEEQGERLAARTKRLLAALNAAAAKARPGKTFNREELYDRPVLCGH